MYRLIGSIVLVVWLGVIASANSSSGSCLSRTGSDSLAGCYDVIRSEWQPRVDLGRDSFYVRFPSHVIIDSTHIPRRSGWRMLRDSQDKQTPVTRNMWRRVGPRRIEIIWAPSGLSGVSGRFDRTESGFRGEIQTFWDMSRTRQRAEAVLTRTACT